MTKFSTILLLSTLSLFNGFGQTGKTSQKIENIDLTRKVCEIIEIKRLLLTKDEENNDAVFVYLDTTFFDEEIFDRELPTPFYVWYKKTFFFYNINYWLLPTSIDRKTNEIDYNFRTCSFVKDEKREYYEGQVTFIKVDNDWQVKKHKITKTKFSCGQTKK
jgi:hypothetical protein